MPVEASRQPSRRLDEALDRRPRLGLDTVALVAGRGTRQYLLPDQRQKALETRKAAAFADACVPTVGRQNAGGDQCLDQRLLRFLVRLAQIADASLEAAGPRSAGLGAEQPAPQLAAFLA
jgi:hypothetical protein